MKPPRDFPSGPSAPFRRRPLIVAIDGPSGVGKSTVARRLAARLGVPYLETGAMYRAVGWRVREEGIDPDDRLAVERLAAGLRLSLERIPEQTPEQVDVRVEGAAPGERLRDPEVAEITSRISAFPGVRRRLVDLQREFARQEGAVLEGRDIGTRVFPETPHKFFLDAPVEVRIQRRFGQLQDAGRPQVSLAEVGDEVVRRDHRDTHRGESPLAADETYVILDTGSLSVEEVVERIVALVEERRRGGA